MTQSIIRLAAVSVFLGRAWQHIRWDAPYRAVLWREDWMMRIVQKWFGLDWESWVTDVTISDKIDHFIDGVGWIYLLCAILCVFVNNRRKWMRYPIVLGSFSLLILATLYFIEKGLVIAQLIEYSAQVFAPIALIWSISGAKSPAVSKKLIFALKVAVALTFLGHGLYAMGVFTVPGNFVYMVSSILGVGDSTAKTILLAAGVLDMIAIVGLFSVRTDKYALIYCVIWGLATAIARMWSGFSLQDPTGSISQWLHETVMRFPHGLLPLAVFFALGYSIRRHTKSID